MSFKAIHPFPTLPFPSPPSLLPTHHPNVTHKPRTLISTTSSFAHSVRAWTQEKDVHTLATSYTSTSTHTHTHTHTHTCWWLYLCALCSAWARRHQVRSAWHAYSQTGPSIIQWFRSAMSWEVRMCALPTTCQNRDPHQKKQEAKPPTIPHLPTLLPATHHPSPHTHSLIHYLLWRYKQMHWCTVHKERELNEL